MTASYQQPHRSRLVYGVRSQLVWARRTRCERSTGREKSRSLQKATLRIIERCVSRDRETQASMSAGALAGNAERELDIGIRVRPLFRNSLMKRLVTANVRTCKPANDEAGSC